MRIARSYRQAKSDLFQKAARDASVPEALESRPATQSHFYHCGMLVESRWERGLRQAHDLSRRPFSRSRGSVLRPIGTTSTRFIRICAASTSSALRTRVYAIKADAQSATRAGVKTGVPLLKIERVRVYLQRYRSRSAPTFTTARVSILRPIIRRLSSRIIQLMVPSVRAIASSAFGSAFACARASSSAIAPSCL